MANRAALGTAPNRHKNVRLAADSVAALGSYGLWLLPQIEMTPKGRKSIMLLKRVGQSNAPHRAVFLAFSLIAPSLVLSACMSSEKDVNLATYVDQTEPADVLYNQGLANMNAGRLEEASKKFDAVDRQHPYSEFARKSMVMGAFADYRAGKQQALGVLMREIGRLSNRRADMNRASELLRQKLGSG